MKYLYIYFFGLIQSKIIVIDKKPANLFLLLSKADLLLSYEQGYFKKITLLSITLNEIDLLYLFKIISCYLIKVMHQSKSSQSFWLVPPHYFYLPRTHTYTAIKFTDYSNDKNWYLHGVDCNGQLHQMSHQIAFIPY